MSWIRVSLQQVATSKIWHHRHDAGMQIAIIAYVTHLVPWLNVFSTIFKKLWESNLYKSNTMTPIISVSVPYFVTGFFLD